MTATTRTAYTHAQIQSAVRTARNAGRAGMTFEQLEGKRPAVASILRAVAAALTAQKRDPATAEQAERTIRATVAYAGMIFAEIV